MKGLLTLFTFFPALLCGYKSIAQQSSSRLSLVISPAIFVPVSVAVQAGVQYRIGSQLTVLAEAAYPTFTPGNTEYEKIDYFRTGIEFKYILRSDSSLSKYVSLQNNYLHREMIDEHQGIYYTKTQTFSYSNAAIKSPVFSSALKLGAELNAGKKFFFDAFIGAGLRFVFTEYEAKNVLLTSTEPPEQNLFTFDDAWKYNYTLMRLHGTAGLRLGMRL